MGRWCLPQVQTGCHVADAGTAADGRSMGPAAMLALVMTGKATAVYTPDANEHVWSQASTALALSSAPTSSKPAG